MRITFNPPSNPPQLSLSSELTCDNGEKLVTINLSNLFYSVNEKSETNNSPLIP